MPRGFVTSRAATYLVQVGAPDESGTAVLTKVEGQYDDTLAWHEQSAGGFRTADGGTPSGEISPGGYVHYRVSLEVAPRTPAS